MPFPENDEAPFTLTSGRLGQRSAFFNEHLDLLINGKTRGELEAYRAILLKNGITAGEIAKEKFVGHDYFQLTDPDGHGITVYTTHAGEAPVQVVQLERGRAPVLPVRRSRRGRADRRIQEQRPLDIAAVMTALLLAAVRLRGGRVVSSSSPVPRSS